MNTKPMNRLFIFFVFMLCLSTNQTSAAEPETKPLQFEDVFRNGIASYKEQKYPEAIEAFQKALDIESSNVSALTNLALAQFQAGHKPIAVALLRKAMALDPDFSTPVAGLKFILPQLEVKEIPHEIQMSETLRNQLLTPVSMNAYLLMSALFFAGSGWLLLSYFGTRRRAIQGEIPLPPFPTIGFLFLISFLISSALTMGKIYDYQIPRGTIIQDKVQVMSAPEASAAGLFDLYGGLEVILENTKDDWVQVTYPGALSGWVPKTSVFPTSGKKTW
jgi:tetratricopeptide (TPR) repeat protein